MSDDLRPCPLCGGAAAMRANFYGTHVHAECPACGLYLRERPVAERAEAAADWNRRPSFETVIGDGMENARQWMMALGLRRTLGSLSLEDLRDLVEFLVTHADAGADP